MIQGNYSYILTIKHQDNLLITFMYIYRDFDSSTIVRHIDSTNPSVAYLLGYFRNSEVNSLQIITVIFDPNIFSQTEAEIWWGINKSRILDQYN